jgi:hypothetical protein
MTGDGRCTPREFRARLLVVWLGILALAGVALTGCDDAATTQLDACGRMCSPAGVHSFRIIHVDYVGAVPVCECNMPATPDGGSR